MSKSEIIGTINGNEISLADLFLEVKKQGNGVISSLLVDRIVRSLAESHGISVGDSELQDAADAYRVSRNLLSADDTMKYLEQNNLSIEDLESIIESELLAGKVKKALATDEAIRREFADNVADFERIELSRIVLKSGDLAEELTSQLQEGEEAFSVLAERYSTDEFGKRGGYIGIVERKILDEAFQAKLFADGLNEDDVIGPIEKDGLYFIFRIITPKASELNDDLREECAARIFDKAIAKAESAAEISIKL